MMKWIIIIFLWSAPILGLSVKAQNSSTCRVSLVQTHFVWGDVEANLAIAEKRIKECRECDLIIFPELFVSGCDMKKKDKQTAILAKDEVARYYSTVIKRMQKWARQTRALIVGSTIYKEDDKYYNRLLAVFPDGRYQYYDKHNCFKHGAFSPGEKQLVLSWKGRRFATYICYDLRFPEWSENNGQYDTAIYIANWPASRAADWTKLLSERAVENKAYVLAVNCTGVDLAGIAYTGESCFISPEGKTMAKCKDYKDDILLIEY